MLTERNNEKITGDMKMSEWRKIADLARATVGKEAGSGEPSSRWKRRMLLAEHSPIRSLSIDYLFKGVKSWVSVHLTRHKHGIEHFVNSQRTDRTGVDRDELNQSEKVNHIITANQQAIINISRKRLCSCASNETREAWSEFVMSLRSEHPELYSVCVPECVYRGFCPEFKPCGFASLPKFDVVLNKYRNGGKV